MLAQRLSAAQRQLGHVKSILAGSHHARESDKTPSDQDPHGGTGQIDLGYWKAYDHCAAVVRCYATYERFVIDAVEQWVSWCLTFQPDRLLRSKSARDLYETGVAEILRRKSTIRFADVDRGKLGLGLTAFSSGALPVGTTLTIDPFFATQPNLRLQHLTELFCAVELGSPTGWLAASEPLRALATDEGYNVEEELRQLVERRNEAAHGNHLPTEILGINELIARIDLLSNLCAAIYEFVLWQICRVELGDDFGDGLLGEVTHVWPGSRAFELTVVRSPISVSSSVAMLREGTFALSSIQSIQLDDVPTPSYNGVPGVALGIQMDYLPSRGTRMIDPERIRGLSSLLPK